MASRAWSHMPDRFGSLALLCEFPGRCRNPFYCNEGVQSRVVLPQPPSPRVGVSDNRAADARLRLFFEKSPIVQDGVGVAIVGNLDAGYSLREALFQANEAIDGKFAGVARLLDAGGVVYKMNLGVGAFEQ